MTRTFPHPAPIGSIVIGRRFNGPVDSANGGYAAGSVARFVDGPARVTLRKPPRSTPPCTCSVTQTRCD